MTRFSRICFGAVLLTMAATFVACKTKPVPDSPVATTPLPGPAEVVNRPNLPKFPYRSTEPLVYDLLHMALEVKFDWENRRLKGKAELEMTPWVRSQDSIHLDAKGFLIHSVELLSPLSTGLEYQYNNKVISIALPRTIEPGETLKVKISYTARPYELEELGMPQLANDHGLFFINADGSDPNLPRQIWTQGETESNSCWFPTFDQPNVRCTEEIRMTVADSFVTLSNGLLIGSTDNEDGTRTDHWKMSQPHAPYLVMMAVGDFAIVKDQWRDKEVHYYVEPEFEPYAQLIFGNTPEMLEFFSKKLGVDYPWEKYHQVVARQFISGAMENTSATIHFDGLQHDAREHLDNTNEDYISHELFHQWFGDLVTCESWAHLTLNEAFATYGEYLWIERKYGPDAATYHLLNDRSNYLYDREIHPLIHFHYDTPDDMFDGHSYQKGGQVLHMLRGYLGDEVFFAGLKHYLDKNAYTSVEVHHLRLAFEFVSGEDLNWFFEQWFMAPGHPRLKVVHEPGKDIYRLRITQEQAEDSLQQPTFKFPLDLAWVEKGNRKHTQIWVQTTDTVFEIPVGSLPEAFYVNSEGRLLCEIKEEQTRRQWLNAFSKGSNHYEKMTALLNISEFTPEKDTLKTLQRALKDPFWVIRREALRLAPEMEVPQGYRNAWFGLLADPKSSVRREILEAMEDWGPTQKTNWMPSETELASVTAMVERTCHDSSYRVQAAALSVYADLQPQNALLLAREMAPTAKSSPVTSIATILLNESPEEGLVFFRERFPTAKGFRQKVSLMNALGQWTLKSDSQDGWQELAKIASDAPIWWMRRMGVRYFSQMKDKSEWNAFFNERMAEEKHPRVKQAWQACLEKK